jgi:3-oxoacyl-[acyl-carrier protein] reductase
MTAGRLKGRKAVVTGAGLGIGRAIARLFAEEGATVVIGTRTHSDGEETLRQILDSGGDADLVTCDIGYREQAHALIQKAIGRLGGLDILVHNAGFFPYATFNQLDDETIDRSVNVNLKACFWLARAALPALLQAHDPRVLVTSSVSGNHANAVGLTHYSATKAGVTGFVRNLALELAPQQITVNAVEPGFVLTERSSAIENASMVDAAVQQIPMGRGGDPMDIARTMLFLASSEAAYITGQSIVVDGGLTLGAASGNSFDEAN